jgi:hypothetical protein
MKLRGSGVPLPPVDSFLRATTRRSQVRVLLGPPCSFGKSTLLPCGGRDCDVTCDVTAGVAVLTSAGPSGSDGGAGSSALAASSRAFRRT